MYQKPIKHALKLCSKSKKASVSIEYGLGLALIGITLVTSLTDTGTAIKNYMSCIAGSNGNTPCFN